MTEIHAQLTDKAASALDTAQALTGLSRTDTVNRALQVYAFFEQHRAAGREVLVRDPRTGDVQVIEWDNQNQEG